MVPKQKPLASEVNLEITMQEFNHRFSIKLRNDVTGESFQTTILTKDFSPAELFDTIGSIFSSDWYPIKVNLVWQNAF